MNDILFNGTPYEGTAGSARYGWVTPNVYPDSYAYTIPPEFGQRLAQMSGKIRGLTGYGSLPFVLDTLGTLATYLTFPGNFFTNMVFFKIYGRLPINFVESNVNEKYGSLVCWHDFVMPIFDKSGGGNYLNGVKVRDVGTNGVLILCYPQNTILYNEQIINYMTGNVYWHAFGI